MEDFSQSSTASTIPPEIISYDDDDFLEEIDRVNDLFFGNVELHSTDCETNENNIDESDDDEQLAENNDNSNTSEFSVELSDTDQKEQKSQSDFKEKTCGCVRLYGKPCSCRVDWTVLTEYRANCLETSKNDMDLIIKVQLFHHRNNSIETVAKKHKAKEREKPRQQYYFNGQQVCRETFAFAHAVSRKTIDSIAQSLDKDGLVARTHGNKGKSPKHALTVQDVQNVKQFLVNYANKYGLPLPGRLPNFRNEKALLLPSDKTKAEIHQDYVQAAEQLQYRKICVSEFKSIWLEQCPHILIMKPSTDLCHTCNFYAHSLTNSGNLTEEEKTEVLAKYQNHIEKVKMQRDHYRKQCENAKTNSSSLDVENKIRGIY